VARSIHQELGILLLDLLTPSMVRAIQGRQPLHPTTKPATETLRRRLLVDAPRVAKTPFWECPALRSLSVTTDEGGSARPRTYQCRSDAQRIMRDMTQVGRVCVNFTKFFF
jgi:hypothetical protein